MVRSSALLTTAYRSISIGRAHPPITRVGQNTGRPHVRPNTQIDLRSGLHTEIGGSIGTYRSADTALALPKLIINHWRLATIFNTYFDHSQIEAL